MKARTTDQRADVTAGIEVKVVCGTGRNRLGICMPHCKQLNATPRSILQRGSATVGRFVECQSLSR